MGGRSDWDREAENWIAFARAPGHDAYWYYRDSFFDLILPPPGERTLEVGCGEGRVTRDLLDRGHHVIALDGSSTLVSAAAGVDPVRRYVLADAVKLPFSTASTDLAVAYNSLMDFDDLQASVREIARVLRPDGIFCLCITHPVQYAGGFDNDEPDAAYVLREPYFGTKPFHQAVVRNGLTMRFCGWTRPMEDYFGALFDAGFVVDDLREPIPNTREGRLLRWHNYPMFLHIRAIKK